MAEQNGTQKAGAEQRFVTTSATSLNGDSLTLMVDRVTGRTWFLGAYDADTYAWKAIPIEDGDVSYGGELDNIQRTRLPGYAGFPRR